MPPDRFLLQMRRQQTRLPDAALSRFTPLTTLTPAPGDLFNASASLPVPLSTFYGGRAHRR